MKNSSNRDAKANRIMRITIYVILFLMVFALTLGLLQLFAKGKAKPSNWGDQTPTGEAEGGLEIEAPEKDNAKIQLTTSIIPRKLYAQYGIMSIAETAMQVTATVGTDDGKPAEDGKLDWQLVWKDPQSEWASGKEVSEYVTIQVGEDTLSATLSCLQAFGEQLQLTAQIKTNASVKSAPRTVNYVQRYDEESYPTAKIVYTNSSYPDANLTWELNGNGRDKQSRVNFPGYTKTYQELLDYYTPDGSKKGNYVFTVTTPLTQTYTKEATVTDVKVSFKAMSNNLFEGGGAVYTGSVIYDNVHTDEGSGKIATLNGFDFTKLFILTVPPTDWAAFKQNFRQICPIQGSWRYKIETTVNGKKQEKEVSIFLNDSSFGTFASSVNIGTGDIDFI